MIRHNVQSYTFSHLFYVDDVKLYAESESNLELLLKVTSNFIRDIKMKIEINKCDKCVSGYNAKV